ncbi:unnamed protein product [Coffea canephora]|uniref:DH200=94 genomic scaffold, scaffold_5792 n=1 Tax=Coffea canephora TaxID=49390 RepID=A0A068VLR0_COFCA|nr:unnamed protein product [Coffea canephora]CDP21690.1 unnamed protein product [Coffea canephora]
MEYMQFADAKHLKSRDNSLRKLFMYFGCRPVEGGRMHYYLKQLSLEFLVAICKHDNLTE